MGKITEQKQSIFAAPPTSILIHACNTKGAWGAGVAASFKQQYPKAYLYQHNHCTRIPASSSSSSSSAPSSAAAAAAAPHSDNPKNPSKTLHAYQQSLVGTTLLIPPVDDDDDDDEKKSHKKNTKKGRRHWIACMFTSHDYGRAGLAPPAEILANTKRALADLEDQLKAIHASDASTITPDDDDVDDDGSGNGKKRSEKPGECWAVRINSGLFGVDWAKTKEVLEAGGLDIRVVSREGDDDHDDEKGEDKVRTEAGEHGERTRKRPREDSRGGRNGKRGTMDRWLRQR